MNMACNVNGSLNPSNVHNNGSLNPSNVHNNGSLNPSNVHNNGQETERNEDRCIKDAHVDEGCLMNGGNRGAITSVCLEEKILDVIDVIKKIDGRLETMQNDIQTIRRQVTKTSIRKKKTPRKQINAPTNKKKRKTQTTGSKKVMTTTTMEDKETQISSMTLIEDRGMYKATRSKNSSEKSTFHSENVNNSRIGRTIQEIVERFVEFNMGNATECNHLSAEREKFKMVKQTNTIKCAHEKRILDEKVIPCLHKSKLQHIRAFDQLNVCPLYESSRNIDEFVQKELRPRPITATSEPTAISSNEYLSGRSQEVLSSNSNVPTSSEVPHSMNMELIRIASFSTFPASHLVSSIALARGGFYYTGQNDKVACFSCKATYGGWQEGDDPDEIHHRISPDCPLFSGEQNINVPMGNGRNISQNRNENTSSNTSGLYQQQSHHEQQSRQISAASDHQSRQISGTSDHQTRQISAASDHSSNRIINTSEETRTNSISNHNRSTRNDVTSSPGSENTVTNALVAPTHHGYESTTAQQDRINEFIRQLDPLGISFERPKYPSYAVLATRVSSFTNWPTSLRQTPRDLATAGFLYAGYGDYTRCFFCGGGLRNWESDDDPWVEHARWFPKCVYVRQNKGDDFVALVQIEHQEQEAREAASGASNLDIPPPIYNNGRGSSSSENEARATNENRMVTHTSTALDILSLPSCQSVLEMGYSPEIVRQAIQEIQRVKDLDKIRGEDLMDIILVNEERGNNRAQMENNPALLSVPNSGISQTNVPSGLNDQSNVSSGLNDHSHAATKDTEEAGAQSMELLSRQLDNTTLEDTRSLIEENRQLKNQRRCKICLEEDASIAMLPCGHLCCCPECAPAMRKCPICRQFVKGTVKTWLV